MRESLNSAFRKKMATHLGYGTFTSEMYDFVSGGFSVVIYADMPERLEVEMEYKGQYRQGERISVLLQRESKNSLVYSGRSFFQEFQLKVEEVDSQNRLVGKYATQTPIDRGYFVIPLREEQIDKGTRLPHVLVDTMSRERKNVSHMF